MRKSYDFTWSFPLPRTHTGMLLGNGTLGAMVWGEGGTLRITLGRADWWDHRGGSQWTRKKNFKAIRRLLEANDEAGIQALFAANRQTAGDPAFPSVLPVGRVEIDFGEEASLRKGFLDHRTGSIEVELSAGDRRHTVRLLIDSAGPAVMIETSKHLDVEAVRCVPAWEYVGKQLAAISFRPPRKFRGGDAVGWVQETPRDQALCVTVRREAHQIAIAAVLDADAKRVRRQATAVAGTALRQGFDEIEGRNRLWWKNFWRDVPRLRIPNARLQFLYDYGMYKFATLTNPDGVPATLQGPWIEEYQMPPWSSDYHFNINVQMCYWPAYHGNRLAHLRPLFRLIESWMPVLRQNAKCFLGIDDGIMLPHAVDDRCTTIGSFWTGTIDHGCTAWVAQMMFHYYLYTGDKAFLKRTAFPFMKGAMRVYEGMLERSGDRLALPVSTSPEYGGCAMTAWGRNASFQLACVHMLAEALGRAAEVLGETPSPAWEDISRNLPKASLFHPGGVGPTGSWDTRGPDSRIGLWDGRDLEESHRHHSHLGAICPFDVLDPVDPEWQPVLERSIAHWIYRGPGLWSGWCVPWAAMIHLRFGNADMAEMLLETLERVFTNEGHGTRHNGYVSGFTLMGVTPAGNRDSWGGGEIMQMDAGMSAVAAIMEMMLHTRRGVNYLFAGAPGHWRKTTFGPMRTEGAFLVSAAREDGEVTEVEVTSPKGGVFRLANPWKAPALVRRSGGRKQTVTGDVLDIPTRRGENLRLSRANEA